jgi:hypothetical protein
MRHIIWMLSELTQFISSSVILTTEGRKYVLTNLKRYAVLDTFQYEYCKLQGKMYLRTASVV